MEPTATGAEMLRAILLAGIFLLAGCAATRDGPRYPEGPLPAPARTSDASAYAAAKHALLAPVAATWNARGEEVDVTLLAPSARGPFPLVVYLPGLGESPGAGSAWRRAWAEAGYVVLSAQPRVSGAGAWTGDRARSFDFRAVALEHFSPPALPARIATIHGVIDEAAHRAQQGGDGPESRIDAARIVIAGYDLGAMSAMAVAGQSIAAEPIAPLPPAVRSVIALSPYADFAGMGTEARFRDIRLPVLSVTSPEDTDAYGLVTTAAVRRAPAQRQRGRLRDAGDRASRRGRRLGEAAAQRPGHHDRVPGCDAEGRRPRRRVARPRRLALARRLGMPALEMTRR